MMGLDLTLLPFDGEPAGDYAFSHTMLDVERRSELFHEMMDTFEEQYVPREFHTFRSRRDDDEAGYGNTQTTPYGGRLGWVRVEDLRRFADHEGVQDNWRNQAVWAYLAHLPPHTKVALYWH